MKFCLAALLSTALFCAQPLYAQQETLVVTGTAEPIPLAELDRDVSSITVPAKERPLYDSWFDLLNLDPALDLQIRAPGGFLGDLSIRGATFGQTLILLNGMRMDSVQTGHFNLDLPIPMEMVSGMEVLKGSGSALYGSDAIGGVVNVIAKPLEQNELRLLCGGGVSVSMKSTRLRRSAKAGGARKLHWRAISPLDSNRIAITAISR